VPFIAKFKDRTMVRAIKPLWISEAQDLPIGWGYGSGPPTDHTAVRGGYSGPVMAEEKVYISCTEPNLKVIDQAASAASKADADAAAVNVVCGHVWRI
jgi:hypothetical protein